MVGKNIRVGSEYHCGREHTGGGGSIWVRRREHQDGEENMKNYFTQ